jgi:hypothetical protein
VLVARLSAGDTAVNGPKADFCDRLVMAGQRNDRPAGLAPSDGPVGSDTGRFQLGAGPDFHIDQANPAVCRISNTKTDPRSLGVSIALSMLAAAIITLRHISAKINIIYG